MSARLPEDGRGSTGILISRAFARDFADVIESGAREAGIEPEVIHLPDDPQARLPADAVARVQIAYLTRDWRFSPHYAAFGDTVRDAPNLKWVHFQSTGIDQHPFLPALIARGVRLTTSAGSNGEPVGHSAICGMLMLARGFPRWLDAQQRREWAPVRGEAAPRDLAGQTAIVVGLGTIGATVAHFCRTLGMRVIGLRRSPLRAGDPVDEMRPVSEFRALVARADWIVLACPLTPETRHLVDAAALARAPRGVQVVNVARGGVVDEVALIDALRSGHVAGAYLDVFAREPLAADSPLWSLPNVIVTPHSASLSAGNARRAAAIFGENLARYARGAALANERHA